MDPASMVGGDASRRFAGRLAHEVNNVLMALQGYAELMQMAMGPEPSDEMAGIRRACDRLGLLTRRLLQFGGRWALRARELGAAELVTAIAARAAARRAATPGVELAVAPFDPPDHARLLVDIGALEACTDAIADNAIEAMRGAGRLALTARLEGALLAIEFADNGRGMEPDVLAQACEPMYTTHRERKAEGLGLSVVVGLLSLHNAALDIDSAPGEGCRVTMYLPLSNIDGSRV